jgi:hypothetical protein
MSLPTAHLASDIHMAVDLAFELCTLPTAADKL